MSIEATTPDIYDFAWVRGTNVPVIMRFKQNDIAIPFDDSRMTVSSGSTFLFRLSISEGGAVKTDAPNGEVTFTPTAAQTRLLVKNSAGSSVGKNQYEVELRDGASERVYIMGTIAGIGGLNDDEVII